MWPPKSFNVGDNTVVLTWIERFYLEPPTKRERFWKLVFQFVSGQVFYITYDTEADARNNFEKIRNIYKKT